MFVVEKGGKSAANIENAEKIQFGYNPILRAYCVEIDDFENSSCGYCLAQYETEEAAGYVFQQIIIAIARGDKVFFMLSDEEIENAIRS